MKINWLKKLFKKQKSNTPPTKVVKVEITYPYYVDITKIININVPIGLSEENEDKYINELIERDYAYLYGV